MDTIGLIYFTRYFDGASADIMEIITEYYVKIHVRIHIRSCIIGLIQSENMFVIIKRQEFININDPLLTYWVDKFDKIFPKSSEKIDYYFALECRNSIALLEVFCFDITKIGEIYISYDQLVKLVTLAIKNHWEYAEFGSGTVYHALKKYEL